MHVNEVLKQNPKSTDYKIMRINQVCQCVVNYISYYPKDVESVLYSEREENERSQWSDLTILTAISKAFTDQMKLMIKDQTYFEFTYQYENNFLEGNRNIKSFFEKMY